MARPLKLTDEVQEALCEGVRRGLTLTIACRLRGIAPQTARRWARLGRQRPQSRYGAFWTALKKCDAEQEMALVALIRQAAENQVWQAAAWLLERSRPGRWSNYRKEIADIKRQFKDLRRRAGLPPWEQTDPDRSDDDTDR